MGCSSGICGRNEKQKNTYWNDAKSTWKKNRFCLSNGAKVRKRCCRTDLQKVFEDLQSAEIRSE